MHPELASEPAEAPATAAAAACRRRWGRGATLLLSRPPIVPLSLAPALRSSTPYIDRRQQRRSVSAMAGPSLAQLDAKLAALPSSGAYLLFKGASCRSLCSLSSPSLSTVILSVACGLLLCAAAYWERFLCV